MATIVTENAVPQVMVYGHFSVGYAKFRMFYTEKIHKIKGLAHWICVYISQQCLSQ